jgi:hypothetical protein
MLNDSYLVYGLNALSRAHSMNYFADGHRGGAIISGYYLCQETKVEDGVSAGIQHVVEKWVDSDLCTPFPEESARPELLHQITDVMESRMGGLVEAGHNIILPTLALKAFRDRPDAVTPERVSGICKLVESFGSPEFPDSGESIEMPPVSDTTAFVEFVLGEFVDCSERFNGRGQGWSGHLLTYGRALTTLHELGTESTLRKAEEDFLSFIHRIRIGPGERDIERDEHPPLRAAPVESVYWDTKIGDSLGHSVKYPYGYYGLLAHVRDPELKQRCGQSMYRVF